MELKQECVLKNFSGVIETVTFRNEQNGYCVLKVRCDQKDERTTVVGNCPPCHVGENIQAEGSWIKDPQYGLQFKAAQIRIQAPKTLEGIERYLASGMVQGIGPHFAKRLIAHFGADVLDVIEKQPDRLQELEGIGKQRQDSVVQAWKAQTQVRDLMVFLHSIGVGTQRANQLYRRYGDEVISMIRQDPYCLIEHMPGFGFVMADKVANALGIVGEAPARIRAGILYTLKQAKVKGHCAYLQVDLLQEVEALLGVEPTLIHDEVMGLVEEKALVSCELKQQDYLYLESLYRAEVGVAKQLTRLLSGRSLWSNQSIPSVVNEVKEHLKYDLSPSQEQALELILANKVTLVTGGPGVGKTTLVNSVLWATQALDKTCSVALAAPTGRAAKRLSENELKFPAKTIHRLLEFDVQQFTFTRNAYQPIAADLLILDEASMVDIELMHHLLMAIDSGTQVVIVGDVDQLPAVGAGMVLRDCLGVSHFPQVRLTEVFRQHANSYIIQNAHRFNQGKMPIVHDEQAALTDFYLLSQTDESTMHTLMDTMIYHRIPERFKLSFPRDIQVLTPMRKGKMGANFLNARLQASFHRLAFDPDADHTPTFHVGDKVMQTVNNYDKHVYNGDIGYIEFIDESTQACVVSFCDNQVRYEKSDRSELVLAYATTVHKAQGSEFPAVIMPLSMQHYVLLERNLIYTAMTRAKKLLILVGDPRALRHASRTLTAHQRCTHLQTHLAQAMSVLVC